MASESYPTSLPAPKVRYEYSVSSNKIQTELQGALISRRLRTTSQVFTVRVEWLFSDSEMKAFRDWFASTIFQGSLIFNIDLFFGNGQKTNEAKFVEGLFDYSYVGHLNWRVSARLEVWDADVPNSATELQTAGSLLGISSGGVPLASAILESPTYQHLESTVVNLSTAVIEYSKYDYTGSEALDFLTDATLESGST